MSTVVKTFRSVAEELPGEKWAGLFEEYWPSYRKWYFSAGDSSRPGYGECLRELRTYMPELEPLYRRLCECAGGSDSAARFLSLYCPPAYLSGCTQAVWTGSDPILVRNYDYNPDRLEGVLLKTRWNDQWVIAMTDAAWGVLDGMNESGLIVSLAFGGRVEVGRGFGIPIILRYILEFCHSTEEAITVLRRVPTHMSYNITILDQAQRFATVFVAPDRLPVVRPIPAAANHQGRVEWARHAWVTATLEREQVVNAMLANPDETSAGLVDGFLRSPVYNDNYNRGFGTLYTAVYSPMTLGMSLLWHNSRGNYSFEVFPEETRDVKYRLNAR